MQRCIGNAHRKGQLSSTHLVISLKGRNSHSLSMALSSISWMIAWTDGFFMPQELVDIPKEQPLQRDDYEEYLEFENLDDFIFEADI